MGATRKSPAIGLRRVYDEPSGGDGVRVLVERLWPRGLTKERAGVELWLKEIAPSPALRTWYGHDPAKWEEFKRRYTEELRANDALVDELRALVRKGHVTLVYAAKDEERNSALVLKGFLESGARERRAKAVRTPMRRRGGQGT